MCLYVSVCVCVCVVVCAVGVCIVCQPRIHLAKCGISGTNQKYSGVSLPYYYVSSNWDFLLSASPSRANRSVRI